MKHIVTEKWVDDEGMAFTWEPIEDTLTVTKIKTGFKAKYLTLDRDESFDSLVGDDGAVFLVHFHQYFWIERKDIITEENLRSWYQGEKIDQEKDFWIFSVSALIHSGVRLSLDKSFAMDSMGWDTSHVGAVLVSKKDWPTKAHALKVADGLIETWNMVLSGEVFGIVKETYDKDKNQVDYDVVWGFLGLEYAKESLDTFSKGTRSKNASQ